MADKPPNDPAVRESQLRALVEQGNDVLALVDGAGAFLYVSPSVEQTLGYRPEDLAGTCCLDLAAADAGEGQRELVRELLAQPGSRRVGDFAVRHVDGTARELEISAVNRIADPEVGAIAVVARDLTDRRRIERELAESEQSFRLLADNAHDIIARYSLVPEPHMVYISPSVERVTGYTTCEFYEDPHIHTKLIHPEDRARLGVLMQGSIEDLSVPMTLRWIRKDGEIAWLEQVIVPIVDSDGKLVGTETISREVTDQVRLEEQLRRSQKLEAVGRLAGGIAHDFNNLLGVTTLSAQRLQRIAADDEGIAGGLDMILSATERGVALVQQLLAFSRRAPSRTTTLRLSEVVDSMKPMLRRLIREDIEIETTWSTAPDQIEIDRSQLEQVILNLAINARDAMPEGGTLSFATERAAGEKIPAARADTGVRLPAARVALVVADTGIGLSVEDRERMFDPFFTTKTDGSGLGLAVVYGIVEQSNGHIEVTSQPGRGARFRIDWPVAAAESKAAAGPLRAAELGGTGTILLVEDEPFLRELMAEMIQYHGYRVLVAEDADAAERIGDEAGARIDLLLTDVVLPTINGRVLAERLEQRCPGLRVIFMSGYTDDEVVRQGVSRESLSFLAKPFTETALLTMIRRVLSAK